MVLSLVVCSIALRSHFIMMRCALLIARAPALCIVAFGLDVAPPTPKIRPAFARYGPSDI
jgi:hypothetical protein